MIKEQQFWDWFQGNEAKFFFLNQINDDNEKEQILDDFLSHLHEYCDHLYFEIGGIPDEKQDLIITAEGNIDFFNKVESLVIKAPYLEYWNVIAFKPAKEGTIIEYKNVRLNPEKMYFTPLVNEASQKIGLRIYLDEYDASKEMEFLTAAYLILDNTLGEKANALSIGYIEIERISTIHVKDELIEFTKLPRYVKWKTTQSDSF